MKTRIITFMMLFALMVTVVQAKKVKGNGSIITKEVQISDFNCLELGGNISWNSNTFFSKKENKGPVCYYTQSSGTASLIITIDENLYSLLDIAHSNGKLTIRVQKGTQIAPTQLVYKIKSSQLEMLDISGSIDFILESPLNGKSLAIRAAGASDVYLKPKIQVEKCSLGAAGASDLKIGNLNCNSISVSASGASDIDLKGKAVNGEYNASGSSDINAYDFVIENLKCHASGSSDLYVHVTEKLKAEASGSSDIKYKGNPRNDTHASGSSDIKQVK